MIAKRKGDVVRRGLKEAWSKDGSLPLTDKPSLPAASSRFHQISVVAGSTCHCANVISTTTAHYGSTTISGGAVSVIKAPATPRTRV